MGKWKEEPQFIGKQFDLKVGDIVKAVKAEVPPKAKYKVIEIYDNIFRCDNGTWKESFTKSDYTTGAVIKC